MTGPADAEVRSAPVVVPQGADPVPPGARTIAVPTADDPLLEGAAEGLGGPVGRRVRLLAGWWTPLRVTLLVLFGSLAVGYLLKTPCADAANWKDEYQFTHLCYTDTFASYTAYGLDSGQWPYAGFPTPYPPLTGAVMALAVVIGKWVPAATPGTGYWIATVALLAVAAVLIVVTTARLAGRRRPWDAMLVALAPVLVLHAYTNWDLVAAALLGLSMLWWSRQRPIGAGIWLGLATASKFYPLLFLLVLALLCLRAGRWRHWAITAIGSLVVWAAVVVPVRRVAPDGADAFWTENLARGPDWDSLWLGLAKATGWSQEGGPTNQRVLFVSAVVIAAVAVLVLAAPGGRGWPRCSSCCWPGCSSSARCSARRTPCGSRRWPCSRGPAGAGSSPGKPPRWPCSWPGCSCSSARTTPTRDCRWGGGSSRWAYGTRRCWCSSAWWSATYCARRTTWSVPMAPTTRPAACSTAPPTAASSTSRPSRWS